MTAPCGHTAAEHAEQRARNRREGRRAARTIARQAIDANPTMARDILLPLSLIERAPDGDARTAHGFTAAIERLSMPALDAIIASTALLLTHLGFDAHSVRNPSSDIAPPGGALMIADLMEWAETGADPARDPLSISVTVDTECAVTLVGMLWYACDRLGVRPAVYWRLAYAAEARARSN